MPPDVASPPSTDGIEEIDDRSIIRLLRDTARDQGLTFDSCQDIGCGRSRHDRWFTRFERSAGERRYVGFDTDPEIVAELRADGVDARDPTVDPPQEPVDLTLCLEVLEHLRPEETEGFLETVREHTRKCVAFTTPNFEFLEDGTLQRPEFRECRWVPDHVLYYLPDEDDPHAHKQGMTPETLRSTLEAAFPADEWDLRVARAWPWTLRDHSTGAEFGFNFKLYAVVWRKDAVEEPAPPPEPPALRVRRAVESAGLDGAAPLVVVGLDDSGTELGARIVRHAGVVLDDPAPLRDFAARWVPVLLEHRGRFEHVDDLDVMIDDFVEALDAPRADALWGWEDPESIHLLPFLRAAWARLRVLHLVRDVRDVAGDAEEARTWSDVNLDCADFGERVLRSAYLRVRLEDLHEEPRAVAPGTNPSPSA